MREPLRTERLLLRDVTESDADLLFDLDSDPEVMRFIGAPPADDVAWYLDRIRTAHVPRQAHPRHGFRLVIDCRSREFLGWVFIRPATESPDAHALNWTRPGEEEIGFRYRRSAWGRGVATEAAWPLVHMAIDDPAASSIVACAGAGNGGSLRVLEKLGLERVGAVMLPGLGEPTVKLVRLKASSE